MPNKWWWLRYCAACSAVPGKRRSACLDLVVASSCDATGGEVQQRHGSMVGDTQHGPQAGGCARAPDPLIVGSSSSSVKREIMNVPTAKGSPAQFALTPVRLGAHRVTASEPSGHLPVQRQKIKAKSLEGDAIDGMSVLYEVVRADMIRLEM
jgi:hypothetical protein